MKMTKELTASELQALQTVTEQAATRVASASSLEELLEQNAGELQALRTVTEQAARDVACHENRAKIEKLTKEQKEQIKKQVFGEE